MGNDNPHTIPAATQNAAHPAPSSSEPERLPATPSEMIPPTNPHVSVADGREAITTPKPSRSNAFWLVITLINIGLIVFLVPVDLLENKQLVFIIKVVSWVAMAGFAAGLLWFKDLLRTLPQQKWFRVTQTAALCLLIPLHVSQQSVVPSHPRIEPGTKLEIDDQPCDYEGGTVRLSISNHKVRVSPSGSDNVKEWEYRVSYKEVFVAIFREYVPRWTPLYAVDINTNDPGVEVLVRKTDGDFDTDFRKKPQPVELKPMFGPKPDAKDTFIYRGANNPTGSEDVLYLPYGQYEFVAHKDGCMENVRRLSIDKSQPEGYSVDFESLCKPHQ